MFALFATRLFQCYKDHNVKRHYETKHVSTFDQLLEADRVEKVKQLEDSLVQPPSSCTLNELTSQMKALLKQDLKWLCQLQNTANHFQKVSLLKIVS